MAASRPAGTTSNPPSTTGGSGEIWASSFRSSSRFCKPALEVIGPLAGLARVELGVGLAGLLLELELLGAVVPVGDLLGQPVLHRGFGLGDELELGVPHLLEMLRHDLGDGVALRLLLDLAVDPRALGPIEDRLHARLALGQRPVVEVGRVVNVAGRPVGVELDVEHPLGDDAALARAGEARVLDRVLDVEQHARLGPRVALVHQHRAALEQVAVAFEREVDDRVEQRMARADEGGQRLAVRRHQGLLEGDALVAGQHRLADADQAVAVAHRGRDVGDLVAARLALLGRAAQKPERLVEEGLDVVRLQAAGLGPLHVFADAVDPAGVHGVVGERPFFQQVPQLAAVERVFEHRRQAGAHLGLVAVADGLDEQLAQGSPSNWSLPSTSNTWPPSALRASSSFSSSLR